LKAVQTLKFGTHWVVFSHYEAGGQTHVSAHVTTCL